MINIVNEPTKIVFGNDSIVIQKFIAGLKGGRNLDTTGFTGTINAGHVIITKGGAYKPMPVSGSAYASLPEGWSYAGMLYRSILASKPFASVMTQGQVNSACLPYDMTSIMAAFKTACPHIEFIKDEASV